MARRILSLTVVVACLLASGNAALAQRREYFTPDELPPKPRLHLYLLMGQENMVGRGVVETQDQETHPRVIVLNEERQWIPAAEPLHRRNPKRDGVGPGFTFAKYFATQDENVTIGLVPCAIEGSSLTRWEKEGDLYASALARAKEAMQVGTLKGVLWHHGELDARDRAKAVTYGLRLEDMIGDFRRDLGAPKLPFIVGKLGTFVRPNRVPYADVVNEALEEVAINVRYTACVDTDGLRRRDLETFNAEGARELGLRYAKAMLDVQQLIIDN